MQTAVSVMKKMCLQHVIESAWPFFSAVSTASPTGVQNYLGMHLLNFMQAKFLILLGIGLSKD